MEKKGAYKIFPDRQLIVEYYRGEITIKDLMFFKNVIRNEPKYDLYWNSILDFRDCTLVIKRKELDELVEYFKVNFESTGTRKVAYLTSRPNEAALGTLYTIIVKNNGLNFDSNVFSTVKATVSFFGKELVKKKELVKIIDELKTQGSNVFATQN